MGRNGTRLLGCQHSAASLEMCVCVTGATLEILGVEGARDGEVGRPCVLCITHSSPLHSFCVYTHLS